jgi:hypothetical protein
VIVCGVLNLLADELLQFRLVGINEYLRLRLAPSGWSPRN